jgi:hypothetical protein
VESNSTGGQGSRRAVAPSDDDDSGWRKQGIHKYFCLKKCFIDTTGKKNGRWKLTGYLKNYIISKFCVT